MNLKDILEFVVAWLKKAAAEPSVRAAVVGAIVNLLLAAWAKVAPELPAWFPSPEPVVSALAAWLELVLIGWAASRVNAVFAALKAARK